MFKDISGANGLVVETQLLLGVMNGFVWGLITALIALGLTLILGWIGVINFAHGELYMLGAVLCYTIVKFTGNFWLALAVAPLMVGALGFGLERGVLKPVERIPANTVIATFGLTLILQQVVLATFGSTQRKVMDPIAINLVMGSFNYPGYRIVVAIISVIIMIALWVFLHKTKYGLWVRASKQDREMALAMGISVDQIYTLMFGLGAALAAIGGVLVAPIVAINFFMGFDIIIIAFIIVIVGGLGSLKGSVIAAISIGLLEGVAAVWVDPTIARVIAFLFMAVVIIIRPRGLFGKAG